MRLLLTWFILTAFFGSTGVRAQPRLIPDATQQCVFTGNARKINLVWRNPGDPMAEINIQMRLTQLTSSTAVPVYESSWKRLQVLPGQTILETAALDFPVVRAQTRFLIQWIQNTNQVVGSTEVLVYPTKLLAELQPLVGQEGGALGIFDPLNRLKPLLRNAKVDFVDLGDSVLADFRGKLAIIGPFESKANMDPTLADRIKTIAAKGVAVVWMQPRAGDSATCADVQKPRPSFYLVPGNRAAAVIVQPELVEDLSSNPRSQLNLIYFSKLALHPEPPVLPGLSSPSENSKDRLKVFVQ